jgi:hypothetical protein
MAVRSSAYRRTSTSRRYIVEVFETTVIDRVRLHAFIEDQCDLIERTAVPDDVGLTAEELFPATLNPERLWRIAGIATLVGLAIYEDAERFIQDAEHA